MLKQQRTKIMQNMTPMLNGGRQTKNTKNIVYIKQILGQTCCKKKIYKITKRIARFAQMN